MDKVILFESEEHYEVVCSYAENFIRYSLLSVQIHCNPKVKRYLETILVQKSIVWKSNQDPIPNASPEEKHLLIFTSPYKSPLPELSDNTIIYCVIHNLHFYFNPRKNLFITNPLFLASFIKNRILNHQFKKLLNKTSGFIFISDEVKDYYNLHYSNKYLSKKGISFPTFRMLEINHKNIGRKKRVIIPGSENSRRRNHMPIVSALQKFSFPDIEFIFLGQAGEVLLDAYKSMKANNDVQLYEEELPMISYYDLLSTADLIILTMYPDKFYGGIKETFSFSTYSALLMDVFSCSIPALKPTYIPINKTFKPYFYSYSSDEDIYNEINNYFSLDYINLKKTFKELANPYFETLIRSAIHQLTV